MYFKLLLSDTENSELTAKARCAGLDRTSYVKACLGLRSFTDNIFTVQHAVALARSAMRPGDVFTLSELYGPGEWCTVMNGQAGVLGRNFYNYVCSPGSGFAPAGRKKVRIAGHVRFQNQYTVAPVSGT